MKPLVSVNKRALKLHRDPHRQHLPASDAFRLTSLSSDPLTVQFSTVPADSRLFIDPPSARLLPCTTCNVTVSLAVDLPDAASSPNTETLHLSVSSTSAPVASRVIKLPVEIPPPVPPAAPAPPYRKFCLKNNAPTPVVFHVRADIPSALTISPYYGIIPPKSFRYVQLHFHTPTPEPANLADLPKNHEKAVHKRRITFTTATRTPAALVRFCTPLPPSLHGLINVRVSHLDLDVSRHLPPCATVNKRALRFLRDPRDPHGVALHDLKDDFRVLNMSPYRIAFRVDPARAEWYTATPVGGAVAPGESACVTVSPRQGPQGWAPPQGMKTRLRVFIAAALPHDNDYAFLAAEDCPARRCFEVLLDFSDLPHKPVVDLGYERPAGPNPSCRKDFHKRRYDQSRQDESVPLNSMSSFEEGSGNIWNAKPSQHAAASAECRNREPPHTKWSKGELPWQNEEWITSVLSWVRGKLAEKYHREVNMSTVTRESLKGGIRIRVKTYHGDFLVDAFAGKSSGGEKMAALARVLPWDIGPVLDASEDIGAVLMPDTIELFGEIESEKEREEMTRDYTYMQVGTMQREKELIEAGFLDLRPGALLNKLVELEHDGVFREMRDHSQYKDHVRWFGSAKVDIQEGLTKLTECSVPTTIVGVDNFGRRWGETHYWFFECAEGFVGYPIASNADGRFDECVLLREWSSFGQPHKVAEWREIGKWMYYLCVMVVRLTYAKECDVGAAERDWWVARAGRALESMKEMYGKTVK